MERRVICTITFVLGILTPYSTFSNITIGATAIALLCLWRESLRTKLAFALMVLAFLTGLGRCLIDRDKPLKLNRKIDVRGTIQESPRRWGRSSVFLFEATHLADKKLDQPLTLLVKWSRCEQDLAPGDEWALSGSFSVGRMPEFPGGFNESQWLWTQRSAGVLQVGRFSYSHFLGPPRGFTPFQLACRTRACMMRTLGKVSDEASRALIAGVVFGETQSLPKSIQKDFQRTGTSHLLAASGMNVALLAGLILGSGRLLGYGPWRVAPLAFPAVIGYAFLAGCAPSITRAATGTCFALLSLWLGRTTNPWNSLSLSIWILLLWDPRQLHDLGFQLSVAAVAGLMAGPEPKKHWGYLKNALFLTWNASLATLPIFWHAFGTISTTLLLANLVLGPMIEILFPLGLLLTITDFTPLLILSSKLAQVDLWLVRQLSTLSDPLNLSPPPVLSWAFMFAAMTCWVRGNSWSTRYLSVPLVVASIMSCHIVGQIPTTSEKMVVRRSASEPPVIWQSHQGRETIYLEEHWQKERAISMIRKQGCLRAVKTVIGAPNFQVSKNLRWSQLEPYLPTQVYLEVVIDGQGYSYRSLE